MDNSVAQAENDAVCEWCNENEVQINTDKNCYLYSSANNNTFYHCGKKLIPTPTSFKDLRVVR